MELDISKVKSRIEMESVKNALEFRQYYGGRIAWQNTASQGTPVYWYSYLYTMAEIMADLPGSWTIN